MATIAGRTLPADENAQPGTGQVHAVTVTAAATARNAGSNGQKRSLPSPTDLLPAVTSDGATDAARYVG